MTVVSERLSFGGYFLSCAVVLLLSVVLSSSFVQVASASARVNDHCMALGINSDGTPIHTRRFWPTGVLFLPEDEEAYVWMSITLDERMTIAAQWRFPNGSIYQVDEKTCDEGSQYVWFSVNIKDYLHACMCAHQWSDLWEVKVFADGIPLFTKQFHINQPPPFPWTTILTMVGVVVAVIASPILLVFSKMKRPPPKLSFALSLVGGLMVAISGFFRGALGGSTIVFGLAGAMGVLFGIIATLFLGVAISISALSHKGVVVLVLSVISLFCFMSVYYALMQGSGVRLYVLTFVLGVTGSVCSILGGLLIRRKT